MRFSPHTAPRSILSKSLDPFPRSRISSFLPLRPDRTHLVTFSCSNWTLSIFIFDSSQRRRLFSLPNICGSNHDLIIRTRDLSRSIPLPLILRESERSFSSLNLFIWNLGSSTSFLFTYFFYFYLIFFNIFPSLFLYHSLSPIGLIL
jgi:hypothetical protein